MWTGAEFGLFRVRPSMSNGSVRRAINLNSNSRGLVSDPFRETESWADTADSVAAAAAAMQIFRPSLGDLKRLENNPPRSAFHCVSNVIKLKCYPSTSQQQQQQRSKVSPNNCRFRNRSPLWGGRDISVTTGPSCNKTAYPFLGDADTIRLWRRDVRPFVAAAGTFVVLWVLPFLCVVAIRNTLGNRYQFW